MIDPKELPSNVEQLTKTTEYATGFERGVQPDWLVTFTTGAGSVNFTGSDGGKATISTGTNAVGDGGRIRFGTKGGSSTTITPDNYDVLVMTTVVSGDDDLTQASNRSRIYVDSNNRLLYLRESDQIDPGSGVASSCPAKEYLFRSVQSNLVIDTRQNYPDMYVVVGGMISQVVEDSPSDFSQAYNVEFLYGDTQDTTANREMNLEYAALRGYVEK